MKVIMDIAGIDSKVIVSFPECIDKKEAREMAIETVCMIKETDIDVEEIIKEKANV